MHRNWARVLAHSINKRKSFHCFPFHSGLFSSSSVSLVGRLEKGRSEGKKSIKFFFGFHRIFLLFVHLQSFSQVRFRVVRIIKEKKFFKWFFDLFFILFLLASVPCWSAKSFSDWNNSNGQFFFLFLPFLHRLIKWACPVSFVITELAIHWQLHRRRIAEYRRIN